MREPGNGVHNNDGRVVYQGLRSELGKGEMVHGLLSFLNRYRGGTREMLTSCSKSSANKTRKRLPLEQNKFRVAGEKKGTEFQMFGGCIKCQGRRGALCP